MTNAHPAALKGLTFSSAAFFCAFLFFFSTSGTLWGQCTNPTIPLPDVSIPVDGDVENAYCVTLTFDPQETGLPSGISMDIWHTWQGDLGIWILANGNYLNIVQRPGVLESCFGGCPCGNSENLGTQANPATYIFSDAGTIDPESGMNVFGGSYGITSDDGCGLGTPGINSFMDLWDTFDPGEEISAILCISDHAENDFGEASNITFLFPNPVICGCTDPAADNYDPAASVEDGSCTYSCPSFGTVLAETNFEFCEGDINSFFLIAEAPMATGATFSWTGTSGGTTFLVSPSSSTTLVFIAPNFTGAIEYTVMVTDVDGCTEFATAQVVVHPLPIFSIIGPEDLCAGDSLDLQPDRMAAAYLWSTGDTEPLLEVKTSGTYGLTLTDVNGCSFSDELTVQEYPLPLPLIQGPASSYFGEDVNLRVLETYPEYLWSTGGTTQLITVDSPTVYQVTITDENGCPGIASWTIAEEVGYKLFTPNAFSPNLDGVNDYFYFFSDRRSIEQIVQFQVFDRWGGLVFSNANFEPDIAKEGWDGTRSGKLATAGIYVWSAVVELVNGEQVQLQGDVLLLGGE